jgi:thiamine pyrophosphokinase
VNTEKKIFIAAAGELGDVQFFREMVAKVSPAAIICADGGDRHLAAAGVMPDVVVGDMDSIHDETLRHYEESGCRVVRYPRRKDETDTELALGEALALDPAEVWIWGAMGRRLDHTLANLSLLARGLKRGIAVKLVDSWCEAFMVERKAVLDGRKGQTVSLFPVLQKASGVTLRGFDYPLTNADMEPGRPCGVSNRLSEDRGTIEIGSGLLLVIRYFRPGAFPGEEKE